MFFLIGRNGNGIEKAVKQTSRRCRSISPSSSSSLDTTSFDSGGVASEGRIASTQKTSGKTPANKSPG